MRIHWLGVGIAVAVVLPTTSACAAPSDEEVAGVARSFYEAVGAQDGATACRLLAPPTRSEVERSSGEPCAQGILEENVQETAGTPRVDVYATMAIVRWAQETTFVTRYDTGWHVYAAGCSPDPRSPRDADRFDCDVQGG